jgi:hypothetical protein
MALASTAIVIISTSASAQTTVVQRPDGGTATVTVQSDGSGNTMVFTQGIAGGTATAPPQGVVGGVGIGVVGPQSGPLPRDPRDQPTGTARLRGHIIAADTGRPLRRATVRLQGQMIGGARTTTTDQDGRFEFTDLPASRYIVNASRTGYVAMAYGQKRPNASGQPVDVREGATVDRIDISLPAAGVITGRVLDEMGEPVDNVLVSALRQQYMGGTRRQVPVGAPSSSNDIGEFRIHGLAPGDYYVSASPRGQMGGWDVTSDRTGYAPTYYPSAPSLDIAQRVTVRGGDTLSNIVVMLSPARLNRVSGIVLDGDGRPARSGTVLATLRSGSMMSSANGFVRPDGSFQISGLADGDYVLRTAPMMVPGAQGPQAAPLLASARVTLAGSDVTNIVLQPAPLGLLSGRVTGDPAALAHLKPGTTQVLAGRLGPPEPFTPTPPPAPLHEDFSFAVQAYPGRLSLRGNGLNGLLIRSVHWNGVDVTRGFDFEAGSDGSGFEIEMTDRTARLMTTVTTSRGEPVVGCDVIIFSTDDSWWGTSMPGYGGVGRTTASGTFESQPLLPGSYYVVAIDGVGPLETQDPDFLESVLGTARRVTVTDGETASVQVKPSDR